MSDFEDSLLPEGPFAPFGVLLLNEQQIQAEWQSAKEVGGSCLTRVNKTVLMLSAALAAERDRAIWITDSWFGSQMGGAGKEETARLFRQKRQLVRELASGCKKLLRRFFSGIDVKILSVYRRFLEQAQLYLPQELAMQLGRQTLAMLRKKTVPQEDLPALIYWKTQIFCAGDYARYRHAVVCLLYTSFLPVQKSDTNNGIKMEVVSADIRGDTARIYITMQDLIGDRVDETIDLYDSYDIRLPFDGTGFCGKVGYDPNTRTRCV